MCKTCSGLWNRNVKSSLDIHKIVDDTNSERKRPAYLSQQESVNATTSVVHNQILHEDAKPQHDKGEMVDDE